MDTKTRNKQFLNDVMILHIFNKSLIEHSYGSIIDIISKITIAIIISLLRLRFQLFKQDKTVIH